MTKVYAPISIGELIDKITILEIKLDMIRDPESLRYIELELQELDMLAQDYHMIKDLRMRLRATNLDLWHIEERKRELERDRDWGTEFVSLARRVYQENDRRAQIKLEINRRTGSTLREIKSHAAAQV